jgi:hypothetical protein
MLEWNLDRPETEEVAGHRCKAVNENEWDLVGAYAFRDQVGNIFVVGAKVRGQEKPKGVYAANEPMPLEDFRAGVKRAGATGQEDQAPNASRTRKVRVLLIGHPQSKGLNLIHKLPCLQAAAAVPKNTVEQAGAAAPSPSFACCGGTKTPTGDNYGSF